MSPTWNGEETPRLIKLAMPAERPAFSDIQTASIGQLFRPSGNARGGVFISDLGYPHTRGEVFDLRLGVIRTSPPMPAEGPASSDHTETYRADDLGPPIPRVRVLPDREIAGATPSPCSAPSPCQPRHPPPPASMPRRSHARAPGPAPANPAPATARLEAPSPARASPWPTPPAPRTPPPPEPAPTPPAGRPAREGDRLTNTAHRSVNPGDRLRNPSSYRPFSPTRNSQRFLVDTSVIL